MVNLYFLFYLFKFPPQESFIKMNIRITIVTLFLFIVSVFSAKGQQTINDTLTHDGVKRTFILYIPASYMQTKNVPLLINMHGLKGTAESQMNYGDFRPISEREGFIIVHPQGLNDDQGRSHWNFNPGRDTVDDVGFLLALIDQVSSEYSVDNKRVYSAGFSQGAFMSFYLVCHLGEKIAGIGAVAGATVDSTGCHKGFPMPIIQIHGTLDGLVSYDNYKIQNFMNIIVDYNICESTPKETSVPNSNTSDGSDVTHMIYKNGDKDISLEHFRVNSGGHTWPGTKGNRENTNYDIDASEEIWRFLSQFSKDGVVSGVQNTQSLLQTKVYPNPCKDEIQIESSGNIVSVTIRDLSGKAVSYEKMMNKKSSCKINTDKLPSNLYTVFIQTVRDIQVVKLIKL